LSRRAILAVLVLCLTAAACGTRVTDEAAPTATSLVERTVSGSDATTSGGDVTMIDLGSGTTTDGGTTGGTTTGSTGGTTSGTGGTTTGGIAVTGTASGPPIVLGAVGTKSGLVGSALEYGFRGLVVWERWVNSHGGVQGRPVKVIQVDDAADPGKHATAVRRLILEEGVQAFVGNIAPFTFSAGVPLLEEHGIPAIGGDGGDGAWFRSPLAFPINGQTVSRSRPAAKWALANLTQRRAAVFYVNEADAPKVLAGNFKEEWTAGGGQVVVDAGVSLATADFTGEVLAAKNERADILFIVLEKAACNRFLDATQRQGYKPIIIAPACIAQNARDHKSVTTGIFYAAHAAKPVLAGRSPAEDEALAAVKRFDPSMLPDGAFMFGWLAGKLFEAAMAQPGAVLNPAGITAALERLPATDLGGLTPTQAWPKGDHPEGRCGMISRFNGTALELLTPEFLC
jgi:branched-chain amino acid transport system substrate-binding protein